MFFGFAILAGLYFFYTVKLSVKYIKSQVKISQLKINLILCPRAAPP